MVDSRLSIVKRLLARGSNCLESGFDGNLERPRAALVVKRACIPEALLAHLGGLAKEQVRKRRIDICSIAHEAWLFRRCPTYQPDVMAGQKLYRLCRIQP